MVSLTLCSFVWTTLYILVHQQRTRYSSVNCCRRGILSLYLVVASWSQWKI